MISKKEIWFWHSCFASLHLWNSLVAKRFFFYTANNPSMFYSGAFLNNKSELLGKLNPSIVPKGFSHIGRVEKLPKEMDFPVIAKPEMGVTGLAIKKCNNLLELNAYMSIACNESIRIESYVDRAMEFGVMFYYYPVTGKPEVSIIEKRYPRVIGDGQSTLEKLIDNTALKNQFIRRDEIKRSFDRSLDKVLEKGEVVVLDYVGNASNGSSFHRINVPTDDSKIKRFLVEHLYVQASICFTRLDIKANSLNDLLDCDFLIIEHNGVKSEPLNIFIKDATLISRYRAYKHHWRSMRLISEEQRALGHQTISFNEGIREFFKQRKKLKNISAVMSIEKE